jgi:hypothetical protein
VHSKDSTLNDPRIRFDALMVNNDLRARIAPRVQEKVITAARKFTSADEPNATLTLHRFMLDRFAVSHARVLATEIEELSELEIDRLQPCEC